MRTTKRFTPKVIERFERQGRGTGTYADYIPWHRITRGDPASSGRSHLLNWRGRLRELLSDGEYGLQLFATMLPDLDDSLEQFVLSPTPSAHPLAAYGERDERELLPGTEELARSLGIRHPRLTDKDKTVLWRPSTDLVLVSRRANRPRHALALAFKPNDWSARRRTRRLLELEREFWRRRNVPWLLITPQLSDARVVLTLRRIGCWALDEDAPFEHRVLATKMVLSRPHDTVTTILERIGASIGSMELAQKALWQAVWRGELPVDLRRGWRPHVPLSPISSAQFQEFNPVASGRTAWI